MDVFAAMGSSTSQREFFSELTCKFRLNFFPTRLGHSIDIVSSECFSKTRLHSKGTEIRQVLFEEDGNLLDLTKEGLYVRKYGL